MQLTEMASHTEQQTRLGRGQRGLKEDTKEDNYSVETQTVPLQDSSEQSKWWSTEKSAAFNQNIA